MHKNKERPTEDRAPALLQRFSLLVQEREPYNQAWDDITEYVLPSRGTLTYQAQNISPQQNPERKSRRRLDSTATYAHRALTARVIGEFTNSGSRWFDYRAPDPDIDKLYHVRSFLQKMSDKVYRKLNASSFQMSHVEFTSDWNGYGTACMLAEDQGKEGYIWTAISPAEIYIAEDERNDVVCVYRQYQMTYKQLVGSFGHENIPDDVHSDCAETPHKRFEILHCVEPNDNFDASKGASKFFAFHGIFVLKATGTTLKEGFFKRKPYIIARFWKRPNEVYGGSPAMDALPDIRMLNVMKDIFLRSAQLTAAPPMGLAHDSVVSPLRLVPYGINYGAISPDGKDLVKRLFEGGLNLRDLQSLMTDTVQAIRAAFFVDPLMNREASIRTAAEVGKRATEEMTGLAPFLARFDVEYLSVVLDMMLEHTLKHDNDIEVPEELHGLVPRIEYTGPLAKTQRGQELNNNLQFAQIAQTVGNVDPSLMKNVDWNAWLRNIAELLGVPMDNINSPEDMAQIQQQEQQAQQVQQVMQMAQQVGGTINDAAKSGLINRQDLGLPPEAAGI